MDLGGSLQNCICGFNSRTGLQTHTRFRNMIHLSGPKLPKDIFVACSGGVDSMAVVDFLSKKHNVTVAFFHHGEDDNSAECFAFLEKFCKERKLNLVVGYNNEAKPKNLSMEEFWRNKRYEFLHSLNGQVVTCHHLDDCVETWIWSSMHGDGKVIPYNYKNVVRPFRTTRKSDFIDWCERKDVAWVEDQSNIEDNTKTRNYIRNVIMPHVLRVNPGIGKVVRKKVLNENN